MMSRGATRRKEERGTHHTLLNVMWAAENLRRECVVVLEGIQLFERLTPDDVAAINDRVVELFILLAQLQEKRTWHTVLDDVVAALADDEALALNSQDDA